MDPLIISIDTEVENIPFGQRRAGYVFGGWCYDYEGTRPVEFPTFFKDSLTLYPKWDNLTSADGKIIFAGNGGSGTVDPVTCSFSQPVYEILNTFTPPSEDLIFDGFYEEDSGAQLLSNDEHQKVTFPYTFKRNVTFLPIWKQITYVYYNIIFHYNETTEKTEQYLSDTKLYHFEQPTKENYLFANWFKSNDFNEGSRITSPHIIT